MSKTFECIYCHRSLTATKSPVGQKIVCPYCRRSFIAGVDRPSPPTLPAPDARPESADSGWLVRRVAGRRMGILLGLVGASMWLGLFGFGLFWFFGPSSRVQTSPREPMAEILKSVVKVQGNTGFGSGFLIDDGSTLITNFHVIEGQENISVKFSDDTVIHTDGFLVASAEYDLAVLHLPKAHATGKPLPLSKRRPEAGANVLAVGNPIGLQGTVTEGIVSACRTWPEMVRSLGIEDPKKKSQYAADSVWIQTSAPISGGNSGGPLLNESGEVIGVNTWQFSPEAGQNLNFAIDIAHITKLVSTLPSMKVRAYASLPRRDSRQVDDAGKRLEAIRERNRICWDWQAEIVGRWYAHNSIAMIDMWGEPRDGETQQRRRLRILDELRGCARRSLQDVEQLGRTPTDSVEPELSAYLEEIKSLLASVSAAYSESTKTFLQVDGVQPDAAQGEWLKALLEPQQDLNDVINTTGEAVRTRLSFLFKVRFGPPIAFTPNECIAMCLRETEVPPELFSSVFTGSPDRFLFATYFRNEEANEAEELLVFIKSRWPKESEWHALADKILAKRKETHTETEQTGNEE